MNPIVKAQNDLRDFYEFANEHLFENNPAIGVRLPDAVVLIERNGRSPNTLGSMARRSVLVNGTEVQNSIQLYLTRFFEMSAREVAATLVHEMTHYGQELFPEVYGKAGKGAYHNTNWVKWMLAVGLQPISATTGTKGTGTSVHHEVIEGGLFDLLWRVWSTSKGHDPALEWGWSVQRYDPSAAIVGLPGGDDGVVPEPVKHPSAKRGWRCECLTTRGRRAGTPRTVYVNGEFNATCDDCGCKFTEVV